MNREVIATGTSKGENLIVRVIEKKDKEIEETKKNVKRQKRKNCSVTGQICVPAL